DDGSGGPSDYHHRTQGSVGWGDGAVLIRRHFLNDLAEEHRLTGQEPHQPARIICRGSWSVRGGFLVDRGWGVWLGFGGAAWSVGVDDVGEVTPVGLIHIHPHGNTALLGQVIKDRSEVTPTPHLTRRRKMRLLVDGHRQGAGDVDGDDHVPQHHRHCLARVVTAVSQGGKLGHYLTPAVRRLLVSNSSSSPGWSWCWITNERFLIRHSP